MYNLLRSRSINFFKRIVHHNHVQNQNITYKRFHTNKLYGKHPILLNKNSNLYIITKRTFFSIFRKPNMAKLKEADGVPEHFQMIYRNTMDRYIFMAQVITSVTAALVCIAVLIKNDYKDIATDFKHFKGDTRATENEFIIYLACFIVLIVVIRRLVTKIPVRIYRIPEQKNYLFVFHGSMPFKKEKVVCKVGDLVYLETSGLLAWKENQYLIKNERIIILFDQFFHRPADLYIMMGQQDDPEENE